MMELPRPLPKLYTPVWIEFSSFRARFGANGGVMFDCDVMRKRKCRRVLSRDICHQPQGWKWQLVDADEVAKYDFNVDDDQDVLNMNGAELEYRRITRQEFEELGAD